MTRFNKNTDQPKKDLYQDVTERIITALEKGCVPWRKPWKTDAKGYASPFGMPANALTNRAYSGINVLLLWLVQLERGFSSSKWLTFRQALEAKGNVIKGERATLILWYKPVQKQAKDEHGALKYDEQGLPVMQDSCIVKSHYVFNIEQCENLPPEVTQTSAAPQIFDPTGNDDVESIICNRIIHMVQSLGVKFSNQEIDSAFYRPATDEIVLPKAQYFFTESDYWGTVLHEVVHSTGHESRLSRIGITSKEHCFGNEVYAFEELVAEIGCAFVCASLGICGELQHESYIDHWLRMMKADKKVIIKAAKLARLAAQYLFSFEHAQVLTNDTQSNLQAHLEDAIAA